MSDESMDDPINEQTVTIKNGKVALEGTLCTPVTTVEKAVLLLPGSGPLDRNQNSTTAQLNIFNAVANHLASHGIASLRFDKRGCGKSKGNFNSAGHTDLVDDARCWLQYLRNESSVGNARLYLLGHSEGTLISPQLIKDHDFIAGQILLMPFLEDFEVVIRRQAENALKDLEELEGFRGKLIRFFVRLSGDQLRKQEKLIKRIRKSRRATFKIRKQVINAKWIREMVNLDPVAIHSGVAVPTLLIGGEKDLQCQPDDVNKLARLLAGRVESHIFADLTHILRADPEKPSVRHYLALTLKDIDDRVLSSITRWLADN
jgi:alpha-beta hydrolase superfamily lysophospholipase